ncbi:hypothetical protein IFY47_003345 [Salmonella enterica]|nr:hypothetical protein [Escherichia coli]EHF0215289.1 hypothetical protein [Salmonella enterica]
MAILVENGRAAVATAIKGQPIYLAWGTGDQAWDAQSVRPSENPGAIALIAETGRRIVTQAMYCSEKVGGEIVVSNGAFTVSASPTKYLYLRFAFDFKDGAQDTIRELGVFVGGTTVDQVASISKNGYFLPSEVTDQGQLLVSEYIDKLVRSEQIKQQFEFVIQF